jgi:hypothetical protein
MCGCYDNLILATPMALFVRLEFPLNFRRYNIAPTDQIPIVRIDPATGEAGHNVVSFRSG